MTVGSYLREARVAAGYSVDDVATHTRIRAAVIKDLESENFESSGGSAYARGHIRTIAKFINADIDRLLEAFEETTAGASRSMIELLEENNATVLRNKKNYSVKFSPKIIGIAASIVVGIAIIIPTGLALSSKVTHKVSTPTQSKSSAPAAAVTTTPVKPSGSVSTGHGVVVSASNGTSWLFVADASGVQLFSGKLSNGASQTFDPTNGLSMRIGNAGAISISVNGKDQGSIGAVGEVKTLTFAPAQTNG